MRRIRRAATLGVSKSTKTRGFVPARASRNCEKLSRPPLSYAVIAQGTLRNAGGRPPSELRDDV